MISIDPGKTTGVVEWSAEYKPIHYDQLLWEDPLYEYLDKVLDPPSVVVLEKFTLYGHKAKQQSGSDMLTSQIIGVVKSYARVWRSKLIEQPASIKPIAEKWSGVKPTGAHNKNSHWVDAYNHGYYYLQKNGLIQSRALGGK